MRGRQAGLAESAEALTGMQRALDERGRRMAAAEARAERGAAAAEAAEAAAAELRAQLAQCAPRNCMSLQIACACKTGSTSCDLAHCHRGLRQARVLADGRNLHLHTCALLAHGLPSRAASAQRRQRRRGGWRQRRG